LRFNEAGLWVRHWPGFRACCTVSPEQCQIVQVSTGGLHWETLDEDISIIGLLTGKGVRVTRARLSGANAGAQRRGRGAPRRANMLYVTIFQVAGGVDGTKRALSGWRSVGIDRDTCSRIECDGPSMDGGRMWLRPRPR
jgi:hypothetical protein